MTTYVFDAAAMLGVGTPSTEPLPVPEAGFITLVVSDGLSLQALRDSDIGRRLMLQQDWYDTYDWSVAALPARVYRVRLPVLGSNRRTASEQRVMLPAHAKPASTTIVAAALLCIHLAGGPDPLDDAWVRCADVAFLGRLAVLAWRNGRLYADAFCDSNGYPNLLFASQQ